MLCFYLLLGDLCQSDLLTLLQHLSSHRGCFQQSREPRLPFCPHACLKAFCRILNHKRPPNYQYTNYQLCPTARSEYEQKVSHKAVYEDLKHHPWPRCRTIDNTHLLFALISSHAGASCHVHSPEVQQYTISRTWLVVTLLQLNKQQKQYWHCPI